MKRISGLPKFKRQLRKIHGWFIRNDRLKDQVHDFKRQLQEAWDKSEHWKSIAHELDDMHECAIEQLHRVARERDEERRLKLEAEDMLLDSYLRIHERDSVEVCICDHSTFAGFHDLDCPQYNEEE